MNKKESRTIPAPTQYKKLENCWYCIISPIRESGIVRDSPTVTISGVVSNMAYAHDMSLIKDEMELSRMIAQIFPVGGISNYTLELASFRY